MTTADEAARQLVLINAERGKQLVVRSQQDNEDAEKLRVWIKKATEEIKKEQALDAKPLYNEWKRVNAKYLELLKPLEVAYKAVGEAMARFKAAEEERYTKALRAAQEAYSDGNLDEAAKAAEIASQLASVKSPELTSHRNVWKFEFTEPEKVPREYCSPDPKKVPKPTGGEKPIDIPGVRWYQAAITTTRAR